MLWAKPLSTAFFSFQVDLKLKKRIVKSLIWSKVLYGAETWTLKAKYNKQKAVKSGLEEK